MNFRITQWIKPKILPLLFVNFIGALGYSVILPFLASLPNGKVLTVVAAAGGIIFSLIGAQIFYLSALGIGLIGVLGFRLKSFFGGMEKANS